MIQQVIYDMDGTLADTGKATVIALAKAGAEFGFPRLADETVIAAIGYANPEFYYRLYPDREKAEVDAFGERVEGLEAGIVRDLGKALLFPGMEQALINLCDRGIGLHIASTGDQRHVNAVLDATGIRRYFRTVSCGEPQNQDRVRRILGAGDPAVWCMVGDTFKDAEAARANGITVWAAGYGYVSAQARGLFDGTLEVPGDILMRV